MKYLLSSILVSVPTHFFQTNISLHFDPIHIKHVPFEWSHFLAFRNPSLRRRIWLCGHYHGNAVALDEDLEALQEKLPNFEESCNGPQPNHWRKEGYINIKEQPPQLGRVNCKCFSLESSISKTAGTLDLLAILHFQYDLRPIKTWCKKVVTCAGVGSNINWTANPGVQNSVFRASQIFTKSSRIEVVGVSIRPDFEKLDA